MVLQNAVWCLSIKWIYISSLQKAITKLLSFLSWESIVIPLAIFLVQSSHLIKYSRWLLHRRLPKYHRKTATKPNLFRVQRKVNSLYINTSVQCHSVLSNSLGPMDYSTSGFLVHHQFQELTQTHSIELEMPSNHLIRCHPLLLLSSIFPSIRVFSNDSVLHIRWPKEWSFSFSINPSNEYSGLISFRMDWLDLLAAQDSQESSPTPQFKSINTLALSFVYSPTLTSIHDYWNNHSFGRQVMSLLFNMLSRLVIAFLPMSKHLLIS